MAVEVSRLNGLHYKLLVKIGEDEQQVLIKNRAQEIARTTNIKGFRAGKVPLQVVMNLYGKEVKQEITDKMVNSLIADAMKDNDLHPVDNINLESQVDDYTFDLRCEVLPVLDIDPMLGRKMQVKRYTINDELIEKGRQDFRKALCEWQEVEREVASGDRVNGNIVLTVVGGDSKQEKQEHIILDPDNKDEIAVKARELLIGKKVGDEVKSTFEISDDYKGAEVAGKKVEFNCNIKKIEEPVFLEIEEICKKMGLKDKKDMDNMLRSQLENSAKSKQDDDIIEKFSDMARQECEIEVPDLFKLEAARRKKHEQGGDYREVTPENAWDILDEDEHKTLQSQVLLRVYSIKKNISPDQKEFERQATSYLSSRPKNEHKFIVDDFKSQGRIYNMILDNVFYGQIKGSLLNELDFDWVEEVFVPEG